MLLLLKVIATLLKRKRNTKFGESGLKQYILRTSPLEKSPPFGKLIQCLLNQIECITLPTLPFNLTIYQKVLSHIYLPQTQGSDLTKEPLRKEIFKWQQVRN